MSSESETVSLAFFRIVASSDNIIGVFHVTQVLDV